MFDEAPGRPYGICPCCLLDLDAPDHAHMEVVQAGPVYWCYGCYFGRCECQDIESSMLDDSMPGTAMLAGAATVCAALAISVKDLWMFVACLIVVIGCAWPWLRGVLR